MRNGAIIFVLFALTGCANFQEVVNTIPDAVQSRCKGATLTTKVVIVSSNAVQAYANLGKTSLLNLPGHFTGYQRAIGGEGCSYAHLPRQIGQRK